MTSLSIVTRGFECTPSVTVEFIYPLSGILEVEVDFKALQIPEIIIDGTLTQELILGGILDTAKDFGGLSVLEGIFQGEMTVEEEFISDTIATIDMGSVIEPEETLNATLECES